MLAQVNNLRWLLCEPMLAQINITYRRRTGSNRAAGIICIGARHGHISEITTADPRPTRHVSVLSLASPPVDAELFIDLDLDNDNAVPAPSHRRYVCPPLPSI